MMRAMAVGGPPGLMVLWSAAAAATIAAEGAELGPATKITLGVTIAAAMVLLPVAYKIGARIEAMKAENAKLAMAIWGDDDNETEPGLIDSVLAHDRQLYGTKEDPTTGFVLRLSELEARIVDGELELGKLRLQVEDSRRTSDELDRRLGGGEEVAGGG